MLEYTKIILEKVSFDALLFQKELRKAFEWLKIEEAKELKMWCLHKFGAQHSDLVERYFAESK